MDGGLHAGRTSAGDFGHSVRVDSLMKSFVRFMSRLAPRVRRSLIMVQDVVMVMIAIPVALSLSQSDLSFDPFSALGLSVWLGVLILSHFVFRRTGLYNTVWRFASTPDFFNIIMSSGLLALILYGVSLAVRSQIPVTGLNEREFIVFFLVAFTLITAPRLIYRYLREGAAWAAPAAGGTGRGKRTLFVGTSSEADIIIRFTRTGGPDKVRVIGIMALDDDAPVGTRIQGVPVVAKKPRLGTMLEEYAKGTESVDLLIFGHGAEKELEEFSELVRVARRNNIAVVQFAGLLQIKQGGALVLENIEMETILRRTTVAADLGQIGAFVKGKRVLVTGGAGSIGRTLVKRSLELDAAAVLVADMSEFSIFQLTDHVRASDHARLTARILDISDKEQFSRVVREFQPDIIFHAAALKHVPLLEENWVSAIKTNVFGTLACAEVAAECGVPQFVLISSDKAADPNSVLGLTKRVAEQIVNALHFSGAKRSLGRSQGTVFTAVRFGNVFGSDGSVATIFQKQIQAGGPVTITDRAMTRYLMTIGEAVDLVIMSAADSGIRRKHDDYGIYMLDMGEPVSILAVAETMIRLAGKQPHVDIQIEFTGIRPGEKLHESLSAAGEQVVTIGVPSVFGLRTGVFEWTEIEWALTALRKAMKGNDKAAAVKVMSNLYRSVPEGDEHPKTPVQVLLEQMPVEQVAVERMSRKAVRAASGSYAGSLG
jgi:FlaA1/EpsC-like NDP-sugar epimerase